MPAAPALAAMQATPRKKAARVCQSRSFRKVISVGSRKSLLSLRAQRSQHVTSCLFCAAVPLGSPQACQAGCYKHRGHSPPLRCDQLMHQACSIFVVTLVSSTTSRKWYVAESALGSRPLHDYIQLYSFVLVLLPRILASAPLKFYMQVTRYNTLHPHAGQAGCTEQDGAHLRPSTAARRGRCGSAARRVAGVERADTTRSWNTPVNAARSAHISSS